MPAGAEHDPGAWRYAFGNGSARGVAAMTVWVLFDQLLSTSPAPGEPLQAWLLNFFKIPSIYEHYGDGSTRATLVHTIARQEQDAMVEGVSTVDWITIILSQGGSGLSFAGITRKSLVASLQELLGLYEALPEVQAYDEVDMPPPKKQAKRGSPAKVEQHAKGIRMGVRKMQAITVFLQHGTPQMLEALQKHLQHHSWKACALSDALLASPLIYPDLMPDSSDHTASATTSDDATHLARFAPPGTHHRTLQYSPTLSSDQAIILLQKVIRSFEEETSCMAVEGKAKCRMQLEDLQAARRTVQWWEPAGREVLSQSLSPEDFQEVEGTVLHSSMMDQEVSNLMLRKPTVFFPGMLPSLAFQLEAGSTERMEAERTSSAMQAAASARYALFKVEYAKDCQTIQTFSLGAVSLQGYLSWKSAEHKRAEAKKGAALVRRHMDVEWQFLTVERMESLSIAVLDAKERIVARHKAVPRVLVVLDFNVSHTRDLTKLAKLAGQVGSILQMVPDAAAWVIAPDFAKQKSGEARDEEVVKLYKAFRQCGMETSIELRSLLRPHPASENRTTELPWFMDSRLLTLSGAEPVWAKAKCVRTRRFHHESTLPHANDLLDLDSLSPNDNLSIHAQNRDSHFKAAQKGPEVARDHLCAFFDPPSSWQATGASLLVDLSVNAGDMAKGYFDFVQSLGRAHNMGTFYYLGLGCGTAKSPGVVGVRFAEARMAQALAVEWLSGRLPLKGPDGKVVEPVDTVPQPTSEELASIPGAKEAWEGLSKLPLSACSLQGNEILIKESWAKEFSTGPYDIAEAFDAAKLEHEKKWKGVLSGYGDNAKQEGGPATDDREEPTEETAPAKQDELEEFESKAKVPGVTAWVGVQDLGIQLLMDDKHAVYLLSEGADKTIAKGTILGAFGSGSIATAAKDSSTAIPFQLTKGDKTLVAMQDAKTAQTLYSLLRDLESKGTFEATLTSYGKAVAATDTATRSYSFPDAKPETMVEYVLGQQATKDAAVPGNFFRPGARSP